MWFRCRANDSSRFCTLAVLWQRRVNGTHYEVRTAGHSRRLYTDGVLHSQYNVKHPAGGGVWDLLMLPAFFLPPRAVQRVLVLGVGGGAAIRQLLHFVGPSEIVGVELDPVHLYVARRFFGVTERNVRIHEVDAKQWVCGYRGPPFDLIVDDLFMVDSGEPVRALPANPNWFDRLDRILSPGGAIVMNFASSHEHVACGFFTNTRIAARYPAAFRLTVPYHDNVVGAFLRRHTDSRYLRRRLEETPGLDPRRESNRLRYRVRRLSSL